jgi:hypothetical protein
MLQTIDKRKINIPNSVFDKWQDTVNILAEILDVCAALIIRIDYPDALIVTASVCEFNPYKKGDRILLEGHFCDTVIRSRKKLIIGNALKNNRWKYSPSLQTGVIAYMGFPLIWPDNEVFGAICVFDNKEKEFPILHQKLMESFSELLENQLSLEYEKFALSSLNNELYRTKDEMEKLRELLPICVHCHRIKINDDYWLTVEDYIKTHSETDLSHGICPECMKKHYSDYSRDDDSL